ncbi:MAG: nucleotide exchange factor GrpE [Gammaproteobacteria bacterium]|nr:nucleotide exchange factor GrpE [Gammaproteobacteria bacterium]
MSGEEQSAEVAGPAAQDTAVDVESLQAALQRAQQQAEEAREQMLRTRAELLNMQRRAERDVENAHKYGVEKFVSQLLPVRDSLELGLAAALELGEGGLKVSEGVALTLKLLTAALDRMGVTEVNPQGQRFNAEFHQAMSMVDDPQAEPNTVLNVYQKGYRLNDRLVRPAMVVVASAGSGSAGQKKADETS